jgi:hypothetical protein
MFRFFVMTDCFVEIDGPNGSFGAPIPNSGCWSSPVKQIAKLHARNLTLKFQTHSIFLRRLWGTQFAKATVA